MIIEGIGELKHEQELVYGNYEVLAVYIDKEGNRYIAELNLDMHGMNNSWQALEYVISPINVTDLIDMLENRLSIEEAFRKNGVVYLAGFNEEYDLLSQKISSDEVQPNMLPESGIMFELSNDKIVRYIERLKNL